MADEHDITVDEMFETNADVGEPALSEALGNERFEDDPEFDDDLEETPRRRMGWITRALVAGILLALAFTGGVLVQKHHDAGTSAGGLPAFTGGAFPGSAGQSTTGSGSSSQGGGSAPAVIGTVVSVKGNRIIVRDLSGKKHVVTTTGSTTITRSAEIPVSKLTAGTTIVVIGTQAGDGITSATTVTVR